MRIALYSNLCFSKKKKKNEKKIFSVENILVYLKNIILVEKQNNNR